MSEVSWVRKTRFPFAVSLALSIVVFPVLLVIAGFCVYVVNVILVDWGFEYFGMPEDLVISILVVAAILLAYFASNLVFRVLRLRWVVRDDRYCVTCDYDLTGNTSGICPECGERI